MLLQFWRDENGGVISMEMVLVGTILCIGLTSGLATLRDAIITELADVAASIACMDQGMSIAGASSASSATASMDFTDNHDVGDTATAAVNSQCLVICNGVTIEPFVGSEMNQ